MKIVGIEKKDSRNVAVLLDNNEKLFLSYETLLKNGLKKDSEISESRFEFLVRENQKYFIKQKAFTYLSRRRHSEHEIGIKLKQRGYNADLINIVLGELKENNYIDDKQFALQFLEEMSSRKKWSPKKIKAELIKKGVSNIIISEVIDERYSRNSEIENVLAIANKKLRILKSKTDDAGEIRQKLFSFLYQRGFEYDLVNEIISSVLEKEK